MKTLNARNLFAFIGFGYIFIFLSSVTAGKNFSFGGVQIWMVIPLIFSLRFLYLGKAGYYSSRNLNIFWTYFLLILVVNSLFSLTFGGDLLRIGLQVSTILGFAYLVACSPPSQRELDRVLLPIIVLLCLFGLMQSAAYISGLPVVGSSFYSGRGAPGSQATSIFGEAAHFAGFLVAAAYYALFTNRKRRMLLLILIVLTALATKSVGGVIGVISVVFLAGIMARSKAILGSVAIAAVMVLSNSESLFLVLQRLDNEVLSRLSLIGDAFVPHQVGGLGSGAVRTINELNYVLGMPVHKLVLGNGFGYDAHSAGRLMALNGFVEIVARGGLLSAMIFLAAIVREKVVFPARSHIVFYTALFFLFFVDGAIAKLAFWLPVGMLLLTDRVRRQDEKVHANKRALKNCSV